MGQELAVPGAPSIGRFSSGFRLFGSFFATSGGTVIPHVILSTDPGQDVDDAAAMAMLCVMHKRGEIILAGVITCPAVNSAPSTARLLLDYAGLTSVPVATRTATNISQSDYFDAQLTSAFNYTAARSSFPDALTTFRTLLAGSPDGSVIIACIGPDADLADLLRSPGDGIDARTGMSLVLAKVQFVAMQGGNYNPASNVTTGSNDFNWQGALADAAYVIANCPVPIRLAGYDFGQNTFIGPLLSSPAASNPLKKAYDLYQTNNSPSIVDSATRRQRAGFDPIAASLAAGLKTQYTLQQGTVTLDGTTGNYSFTKNTTGQHFYATGTGTTATLQAYLNDYLDSYDQGATAPAAPVFSVSEAAQGSVVFNIAAQFFTTYTYSTDGGTTWVAMPANATLTTLTPATAYSLLLRGSRYGLTGPTSAPVAYTTKAVVAPTSIETVPGVLRHFDFTTTALMLPNPVGTGRITSVADTAGSSNPLAPDTGQGPIFVTASDFGATRPAIRSVNGDTAGGNVTGAYARLFGNMPELVGKTDFAMFLTNSVNNDRNDGGRILSLASGGNTDYQAGGFFIWVPAANRATLQLATGAPSYVLGASSPLTHDVPMLLAAICTAGQMQLWVNGVAVGSTIAMSVVGSAPVLCISRQATADGNVIFGDYAGFVVLNNTPTTSNRQYVEGKLAWSATGDGSMLPTGHPYKTAAP